MGGGGQGLQAAPPTHTENGANTERPCKRTHVAQRPRSPGRQPRAQGPRGPSDTFLDGCTQSSRSFPTSSSLPAHTRAHPARRPAGAPRLPCSPPFLPPSLEHVLTCPQPREARGADSRLRGASSAAPQLPASRDAGALPTAVARANGHFRGGYPPHSGESRLYPESVGR